MAVSLQWAEADDDSDECDEPDQHKNKPPPERNIA
ncbi:hypothetical protein SDC9_189899 [bioreactor metagenome]|uniref:Uncharacterized protein n=1 Tax=bioreactor metagenome TaxID=1076179 RepID=A0A645HV43_9ZZZZ